MGIYVIETLNPSSPVTGSSSSLLSQLLFSSSPQLVFQTSNAYLLYTTNDLCPVPTSPFFAQIDISDVVHKSFVKRSLRELTTLPSQQRNIFSSRSSNDSTYTSALGLTIDGPTGRKSLSVSSYAERIAIEKPTIAIAMADEVACNSTPKRILTAIKRSQDWLNELLRYNSNSSDKEKEKLTIDWEETNLFGVLLCGAPDDKMDEFLKNFQASNMKGILIGGIFMGETLAQSGEALRKVQLALERSQASVPPSIPPATTGAIQQQELRDITSNGYGISNNMKGFPLMVQGAKSLAQILLSAYYGVHLISSSYPSQLTQKKQAIVWNLPKLPPDSSLANLNDDEGKLLPLKRSFEEEADQNEFQTTSRRLVESYIDMLDTKLEKDLRPLLPGCDCHACTSHSRAYIHHLFRCNELLGEVLLYQHNQHQLVQVFNAIRIKLVNGDKQEFARWAGLEKLEDTAFK